MLEFLSSEIETLKLCGTHSIDKESYFLVQVQCYL